MKSTEFKRWLAKTGRHLRDARRRPKDFLRWKAIDPSYARQGPSQGAYRRHQKTVGLKKERGVNLCKGDPARLRKDGKFLTVTFPNIPEAITFGNNRAHALQMAK